MAVHCPLVYTHPPDAVAATSRHVAHDATIMLKGKKPQDRLGAPALRSRWRNRIDHLIRAFDSKVLMVLLLLGGLDVSFIAIYLLDQIFELKLNYRWDFGSDHSYAEIYGYVKLTAVAVLLVMTFGLSKGRIYLVWAAVFTYVLLDDALLFHQRLRDALGAHSHSTWNIGQLAVWFLVGMIVLVTTLGTLALSSGHDRTNGILLFAMLLALGFFAVAVDQVQGVFHASFRGADQLFTVMEEGGEQLVQSLTVAIALLSLRSKRMETR
jgi:hypothetical protein